MQCSYSCSIYIRNNCWWW